MDLTKLILRYSDGTATDNFAYANNTPTPANPFYVDWIRGSGANNVMTSGDLVQISFDTPSDLLTRTSVTMSLIPETGSPVESDFKTPATYGADATITLR